MPKLNGVRGLALLAGGLFCVIRGVAYLPISDVPSELPTGLDLISSFIPIEVWAGVWLLAGLVCWLKAFKKYDQLGWGLLVAMMTVWSLAYLYGWFTSFWSPDGVTREYLSASTYGLPAVIIALLSSRLYEPITEVSTDGSS